MRMITYKAALAMAAVFALAMTSCGPKIVGPDAEADDAWETAGTTTQYNFFMPETAAKFDEAVLEGSVSRDIAIVKVVKGFDAAKFAALGATVKGSFELDGFVYYRLMKAAGTMKLVNDLGKLSGVVYAEHELISKLPPNEATGGSGETEASRGAAQIASALNDPETWGRFGHFETTSAIRAYKELGFGADTVYVADIDTGINRIHEDFADLNGNQIVEYAKSAFVSTDGGTTFEFVGEGATFVTVPEDENWDDQEHGSHTAGTIAAVGNNGKGVAGVAWKNVRLISYKCFANSDGSGTDWAVYNGLRDLVEWKKANGITQTIPVNMSLGGSMAGRFELEMINLALANDVVVIASMGNDGDYRAHYPAAYTGVIAVGATDGASAKVSFSSMGPHISVSAPGYNIYSVDGFTNDGYLDMSGTSMAAPFVTGTVAYMLSFNPGLKPDQIKTILESTADDKGTDGWDREFGYGQVNVYRAVEKVKRNRIPASGSVYSTKLLAVKVVNENANYDSGIPGARGAVTGQPVYLYDKAGVYVTLAVTNGIDGTAEFRLLKPGTYTARTNYCGEPKAATLVLKRTADVSATLSFDVPILLIQTVPNAFFSGGATGADSMITLYDATGDNVVAGPLDQGSLDSLVVFGLDSGATYLLAVEPYVSGGEAYTGEYGLNVGFAAKSWVDVDPGRAENAEDADGNDYTSPQAIDLNVDYGRYLGESGDWFTFTMP